MAGNSTTLGKYLDGLPAWARELSEKYYSRSFALFVLYGNVRDLVSLRSRKSPAFVPLDEFLPVRFLVSGTWFCTTTVAASVSLPPTPKPTSAAPLKATTDFTGLLTRKAACRATLMRC